MSCANAACKSALRSFGIKAAGRNPLVKLLRAWGHALDRHRQRRLLLELDDHLLADVGLSREAAAREARKWFWQ